MTIKNIAEVVVGLPVDGPFDYSVHSKQIDILNTGARVGVLFNRRLRVGYVVGFKEKSDYDSLNPVAEILDRGPILSDVMLKLTRQVSEYYGCSWGEVIEISLPRYLRGKRTSDIHLDSASQMGAEAGLQHSLIHDLALVDYLEDIEGPLKASISRQKSVIILVPQKNQMTMIRKMIKKRLGLDVVEYSKVLSVKKELKQFVSIRHHPACIVIGTRSAVFAPVTNLGQIIVLHEEDEAYRQEQSPHYSAPQVAELRVRLERAQLTHVTNNPRIELLANAEHNNWSIKTLNDRRKIAFQLVDMNNYNPRKTSLISFPLQNAIQSVFQAGGQVLLYFNRKGFGTFTHCNSCGHVMKCNRCDATLVSMSSTGELFCRKCNYKTQVPKNCPKCRGAYLRSTGKGIEKVKQNLERLYPHLFIETFDKDTKGLSKRSNIIVATSAILKKKDQFKVALVGALQFDNELNRSDFRSSHKALSLLLGLRQMAKEKFLVQTYMPDDNCLEAIKTMNLKDFYRQELNTRRELQLPPAVKLIVLMLRGLREDVLIDVAGVLYDRLRKDSDSVIQVLSPMPDINPKLRDQYRYNIMLKGSSIREMLAHVKPVIKGFRQRRGVIITIMVDA